MWQIKTEILYNRMSIFTLLHFLLRIIIWQSKLNLPQLYYSHIWSTMTTAYVSYFVYKSYTLKITTQLFHEKQSYNLRKN